MAALGIPVAEYNLGWMSLIGMHVPRDVKAGMRWLAHAAEEDFPAALLQLGVQYASGQNVEQDLRQALAWLLLAENRLPGAGLTENYYQQAVDHIVVLKAKLSADDQKWAADWVKEWNKKHPRDLNENTL
jgi:hypothetical protein